MFSTWATSCGKRTLSEVRDRGRFWRRCRIRNGEITEQRLAKLAGVPVMEGNVYQLGLLAKRGHYLLSSKNRQKEAKVSALAMLLACSPGHLYTMPANCSRNSLLCSS